VALHLHVRLATRAAVSAAAAAGLPVLVYTVNAPELARRLFARGVAGVFTDLPGPLRVALEPPARRRTDDR
jgi:glycerophosphoryl diester phosphodiesterase